MATIAHAPSTSVHDQHLSSTSQDINNRSTLKHWQWKLNYFQTQRPYINAIADRLHGFALSKENSIPFIPPSPSVSSITLPLKSTQRAFSFSALSLPITLSSLPYTEQQFKIVPLHCTSSLLDLDLQANTQMPPSRQAPRMVSSVESL